MFDYEKIKNMTFEDFSCNEELFTHYLQGKRFVIPRYMRRSLWDYIKNHIRPGSFLYAVLCNDLYGAVSAADPCNLGAIPAYIGFLRNYLPSCAWGNVEKVERWLWVKKYFNSMWGDKDE